MNPAERSEAMAALRQRIHDVYEECRKPGWDGWDGYRADPLTEEARDAAIRLAWLLPPGCAVPEAFPSYCGSIDLEWHPSCVGWLLIISAYTFDRYTWCWILGDDNRSGEGDLSAGLPEELVDAIRRITEKTDEIEKQSKPVT